MDRRLLRPGVIAGHLLVLVAVLVCLRLGWWQWDRSHDADGTIQNLGYALLWPCFGGAFIYMWVRFLQLERLKEEEEAATSFDLERLDPVDNAVEAVPITEPETEVPEPEPVPEPKQEPATRLAAPSRGVTVSVAQIDDDDADDPELAAYNQALAAIAEKDRRRAH